jgi:hypothetical protein
MNKLTGEPLVDLADLGRQIVARDREIDNPYTKDLQVMAIHNARLFRGDRLARTAAPHKILDPKAGPLIAVRLNILTRKTLGGLQTDLSGRVLGAAGNPVPGLYAAGEVAGFGGGGMHGYRSLEGSFLGGCLFSGRQAGRSAAHQTGGLSAGPGGEVVRAPRCQARPLGDGTPAWPRCHRRPVRRPAVSSHGAPLRPATGRVFPRLLAPVCGEVHQRVAVVHDLRAAALRPVGLEDAPAVPQVAHEVEQADFAADEELVQGRLC